MEEKEPRYSCKVTVELKSMHVHLGIDITHNEEHDCMTDINEVYFCELCGNKVKVLESGAGTLVCCGEDMKKVE